MGFFSCLDPRSAPELQCLVSHDISLQALVQFLAIPKKPIVRLPEAESSSESPLWHLMTPGKQYAANSGLTIEFWRAVNELPQGRQAACYLHFPLVGKCQQESLSG
uniref:Uncharacterized protein n=1 Tax=Malurus cyaneus samueli TaxID=2593467 RepID=A0A8C5X2Z4_9PASS